MHRTPPAHDRCAARTDSSYEEEHYAERVQRVRHEGECLDMQAIGVIIGGVRKDRVVHQRDVVDAAHWVTDGQGRFFKLFH